MADFNFGTIGILKGGVSSERNISLKSAKAVHDALVDAGCKVIDIDIISDSFEDVKAEIQSVNIDIAFIAMHGCQGEDGFIQQVLDELDIPYAGSGVEVSRRAFNKSITTPYLKKHGLPVADHCIIESPLDINLDKLLTQLGPFPLVVKPSCEGSSIGIAKVEDIKQLGQAITRAFEFKHEVLIEKYIKGREFTVSILKNQALPIVEIITAGSFFDFDAKYSEKSLTEYIVPAPIDDSNTQNIQDLAIRVFNIIGCSDYARVDFRVDDNFQPYILEVNTVPGLTATSLLPKAAASIGINFQDLCLTIVECAYAKKTEKSV